MPFFVYIIYLCRMQEEKQWFENWFDTSFYHILYKNRDDSEAQFFMNNLISHLKVKPNAEVLDLACGKGRHSIYLNQKGLDVTGLDLSKESIAHANIFANETLHFDVHDMRKVYPKKFDFVFNLFTSFGYFEDNIQNQKAINAMQQMLKENGILVIDFLNSKKAIKELVHNEEKTIDGIDFKIHKKVENGFIVKTIQFEDEGTDYSFEERVKALRLEDFNVFFEQANLELKETFGNYKLEKYDMETSDRLIMILKKK